MPRTGWPLRRRGAERPDDPQPRLALPKPTRRLILFSGIGVASYLVALLATVPAGFVIPRSAAVAALGGTIWHGDALLVSGDRLEWRWAPLRTLANLRFAADIAVDGPGTALAGQVLAGAASWRLDDVTGTADARLLRAAAPGLPFACTGPIGLRIARAAFGGDDAALVGHGRTGPLSCAATAVPPLVLDAGPAGAGYALAVTPAGRRTLLARVTMDGRGRTVAEVTREGAAAMPFASPAGGLSVVVE